MREKSEALKCTHTHTHAQYVPGIAWGASMATKHWCTSATPLPPLPPLLLLLMAYGKYLKIKNQNADTLGQLTLWEEGGRRRVCMCVCCVCVLAFPRVLKLPSIYSCLLLLQPCALFQRPLNYAHTATFPCVCVCVCVCFVYCLLHICCAHTTCCSTSYECLRFHCQYCAYAV